MAWLKPYLARNGRLTLRNGDGTFTRPSIGGVTCPSCNRRAWDEVNPERNAEGFINPRSMKPQPPARGECGCSLRMGEREIHQHIVNELIAVM